jgi:predicted acetyltransferase
VRSEIEVRRLGEEGELAAISSIVGWAFGSPPQECSSWLERAGRENLRVAWIDGQIVGSLAQVPMGQWFGGRSVPMVGIAGVAVAPEQRGRGAAQALMHASLAELALQGIALSTLFPATQKLYRGVGYEQAGTRFEYSLRPGELELSEREPPMVAIDAIDPEIVERVYSMHARRTDGFLDRKQYIWDRVRAGGDGTPRAFGVVVDGALEGYLYIRQRSTAGARYDLTLSDLVALTPRAARRLLGFIADHRTLADSAVWFGGPADAMLAILPEQRYRVTLKDQWMLRIVSLPAALSGRGWPAGISTEIELDVVDEQVAENAGRWVLELSDGRVKVSRGGRGRLRIDVRGLAALYSGYLDPFALRRAGLADGDERMLGRARAAFSGPAPCMPDFF